MQRYFVIECDTEYSNVFVYEVSKDFENGTVNYHKSSPEDHSVVMGTPGPSLYGKLDVLLVSRDKLENAESIQPVYEGEVRAS